MVKARAVSCYVRDNCRLTKPVTKRPCARDLLLHAFNISVLTCVKVILSQSNIFLMNFRKLWCWCRHQCRSNLTVMGPIRKSKDYVYGILVYKALDIWKGYYRVKKSLVSYMKPWTEARNNKYMKYHSKLTYQLSIRNVSRKVDYHAGGKWFIHGPKRRKENQLLSLKHPCWLSLV